MDINSERVQPEVDPQQALDLLFRSFIEMHGQSLPEGATATLENFDSIISQLPVDQFRDWLLRMSQNQIFQIGEAFKTEQETCNQILGGVASLRPAMAENGNHENGRLRPRSAA